jgi:flagellar P-ring protein precursor FlgI
MQRIAAVLFLCLISAQAFAAVRIKDIASVRGVRDNQLIGYGLVVGLQGTGDTLNNSPFTQQAIQNMFDRMGLTVRGANLRNRNVAAAIVTADLPPAEAIGSRIDVTVSSLGDASSLLGGTLMLTTLTGTDGQVYASAQGAVSVTGFGVAGQSETLSQGVPTAGRIANGALVEKALPPITDDGVLTLELKNPDYNTSVRVTDAINAFTSERFGHRIAREQDLRSVVMLRPPQISATRFVAEIGDLLVEPDTVARVVVDSRSGTVVIGQDVQISPVAVTHGTLSVRVTETPQVSQPNAFSKGQTVVTSQTQIEASQQGGQIAIVGGASLRTLVAGLNRIGLKPDGIIAILQAIKTAGALQAELVVQ